MLYEVPPLGSAEQGALAMVEEVRRKLRYAVPHQPRAWEGFLRRQAFARASQGSNTIEGYDASLDDAAAIAEGGEPLDADDRTEQAYRGWTDAMTYVLSLARQDDFTWNTQIIRALHYMMIKYEADKNPGDWRPAVVRVGVYTAPDADDVPAMMAEFAARLGAETDPGEADEPAAHPIVRAAMTHLNLVMIHPFRDGNGRMSRMLQSLVLARAAHATHDPLAPIFLSVEEYLGRPARTREYYDALRAFGEAWDPAGIESDTTRTWVRFMITAHLRQARTHLVRHRFAERLYVTVKELIERHGLPERVYDALFDAIAGGRVTAPHYRKALRNSGQDVPADPATTSKDLKRLADLGLLDSHGQARGRYYTGAAKLQGLRHSAGEDVFNAIDDTDPFG